MYMAPEVFRGERYQESVDVFSFALVLLEIVSGVDVETWFEAEGVEPRGAAAFHATGKRLDLSEEFAPGRHSPAGMSALELVERCWHPDPASRPTMQACRKLLDVAEESSRSPLLDSGRSGSGRAERRAPHLGLSNRSKSRERESRVTSLWKQTTATLSDEEQEELFRGFSELMERRKKGE